MNRIDQYIAAATRDNTRRSYRQAIEHYEVSWGGFLPATADSIARYLVDHAETHTINTLRQRLAAIAQWHCDQGFPDPTKASVVKKVLRGIATLHPTVEKRARPLQLSQLEQLSDWLDQQIAIATAAGNHAMCLKYTRDKAIVLVGFWRAFRSDELSRLRVEHIEVTLGEGMTLYLPHTKTDRQHVGTTFKTPALSRLCPVAAYQAWITLAQLTSGPVFRSIDRWGRLGSNGLRANSIIPLLKKLFRDAGVPEADSYSSHSLRRGFASWANANAWDVKALMEYVGWKDLQSALRYIDGTDPFARRRIEAALPARQPNQ